MNSLEPASPARSITFTSTIGQGRALKKGAAIVLCLMMALLIVTPAGAQDDADRREDIFREKMLDARLVSSVYEAENLDELQFAGDFRREHADLLRLYQAYFSRVPDFTGAKYWVTTYADVKAEGVTARRPSGHDYLGEFADYFAGSKEYNNVYGNADNKEFLQRVYQNMLGRQPDQKGFNYWLSWLNGTNPDDPGRVLSKGATVRWVTASTEFVNSYPFGHVDTSAHPSDDANCTPKEIAYAGVNVTGIYRLRDGAIRELCYGRADANVEGAWTRLVSVADTAHFSPVALLGVFDGSGAGIVAYAGPVRGAEGENIGDLWLISAQNAASSLYPMEADLTMAHELTHVYTQLDDQFDFESSGFGVTCPGYGVDFDVDGDGTNDASQCFAADSYLYQWVAEFWTQDELNKQGNRQALCAEGHDFISGYATTSPREDFAESFSGYTYGADISNQGAKYAFFDRFPELKAYRSRAAEGPTFGYSGSLNDRCEG